MLSQYQDSFVVPQKSQTSKNGTNFEVEKREAELIRLRKENEKLATEKYAKMVSWAQFVNLIEQL